MTYEQWINVYQEDIRNTCPFIKDDSVNCYSCNIYNECKYVLGIRTLQLK